MNLIDRECLLVRRKNLPSSILFDFFIKWLATDGEYYLHILLSTDEYKKKTRTRLCDRMSYTRGEKNQKKINVSIIEIFRWYTQWLNSIFSKEIDRNHHNPLLKSQYMQLNRCIFDPLWTHNCLYILFYIIIDDNN